MDESYNPSKTFELKKGSLATAKVDSNQISPRSKVPPYQFDSIIKD
jgi:hypothetical protein